jgi:hypothetical protein
MINAYVATPLGAVSLEVVCSDYQEFTSALSLSYHLPASQLTLIFNSEEVCIS